MKDTNRNDNKIAPKGIIKFLFSERTAVSLLLTAILIISVGLSRPERYSRTGITTQAFWNMKVNWLNCADVVVGGDSRILADVSPEAMREVLGDLNILNFGFGSGGYSADYLDALEGIINPKANRRIIALGITPLSLTESSGKKSGFTESMQKKDNSKLMPEFLESFLFLFRSFQLNDVKELGKKELWNIGVVEKHSDGWSSRQIERIKPGESLGYYRKIFDSEQSGPVSEKIEKSLFERVENWRIQGMEIYGFRPPTTPDMVALENRFSGFSEQAFVEKFEAAGGRWIEIDSNDLISYDGSHLIMSSATAFSKELASGIITLSAP